MCSYSSRVVLGGLLSTCSPALCVWVLRMCFFGLFLVAWSFSVECCATFRYLVYCGLACSVFFQFVGRLVDEVLLRGLDLCFDCFTFESLFASVDVGVLFWLGRLFGFGLWSEVCQVIGA